MIGDKNSNNSIETGPGGLTSIGDGNIINVHPSATGLRQKILREISNKKTTDDFVDSLKEYLRKKTESSTLGLKEKLEQSHFTHLIDNATELKEKFYLHLVKNQQSIAYQQIVCAMIDESISRFTHHVHPLIAGNSTHAQIQSALFENVISVIYKDVADLEYGFSNGLVEGLLFYLTGNCFIRWK